MPPSVNTHPMKKHVTQIHLHGTPTASPFPLPPVTLPHASDHSVSLSSKCLKPHASGEADVRSVLRLLRGCLVNKPLLCLTRQLLSVRLVGCQGNKPSLVTVSSLHASWSLYTQHEKGKPTTSVRQILPRVVAF